MDKKIIHAILEERKALHIEDPMVEKYWDQMIELFSNDVKDTIEFLDECAVRMFYCIVKSLKIFHINYKVLSLLLI